MPALGALGVGSLTSGCTVPGAPLGIVFLPLGDAGADTGFGVGCEQDKAPSNRLALALRAYTPGICAK